MAFCVSTVAEAFLSRLTKLVYAMPDYNHATAECGQVNHIGISPTILVNSAFRPFEVGTE